MSESLSDTFRRLSEAATPKAVRDESGLAGRELRDLLWCFALAIALLSAGGHK